MILQKIFTAVLTLVVIQTAVGQNKAMDAKYPMPIYRFCPTCNENKDIIFFGSDKRVDVADLRIDKSIMSKEVEDTTRLLHFQKVFEYMDSIGYELAAANSDSDIFPGYRLKNVMYFYFRKKNK